MIRVARFVVLTVALASHAIVGTAQRPAQGGARGGATGIISPSVLASWFTARNQGGQEQMELLVLWRGTPAWFLSGGGSGESMDLSSSPGWIDLWITRVLDRGPLTLWLDYEPTTRRVAVQGKPFELAGNNVLFVDDVDAPSGPRVVRALSVSRAMPGSAGQIAPVLVGSPEIMSFLRCDSAPATGPGQRLQNACLQNLGVSK